jgi:predicted HicB family RNase H-like nuclease
MSPVTKAQQKAVAKYMKDKYDEIKIRIPKGDKERIQAHAEAHGESLNGYVGRAIKETMERDESGPGAG